MNWDIAKNVVEFFILMVSLFVVGVIVLTMLGKDMVTAFGATTTLGNIGPGLKGVGPTDNYPCFHTVSKGGSPFWCWPVGWSFIRYCFSFPQPYGENKESSDVHVSSHCRSHI